MSAPELLLFAGSKHDCEQLRVIGHNLHTFVLIKADAGIVQQLLVQGEVDRQFTDVGQSEGALLGSTDDYIAEIANVGGQLDVVERDIHSVNTHLSLAC